MLINDKKTLRKTKNTIESAKDKIIISQLSSFLIFLPSRKYPNG
jgi:hypothetical protein